MPSKAWMTVSEIATEWEVSRKTVYKRIRKAERAIGRPILVTKRLQGEEKSVVGRGDIARIAKASGIDVEAGDMAQINDTLEGILIGVTRTAELLKRVAIKLGIP